MAEKRPKHKYCPDELFTPYKTIQLNPGENPKCCKRIVIVLIRKVTLYIIFL